MARKFLVPIDLSKQELQNAVVQNLASAPGSPVAGQIYFNTTSDTLFFYDGTAWVDTQTAPYSYGTVGEISTIDVGDSASAGTSVNLARADHQHAAPSFGTVSAQTSFGASSSDGSASTIARSDHTHGTPAHDAAAHSAIKISDLAAPSADVSLASHKLTNVTDPTSAQDAATKAYVDGRKVTDLTAPTSAFSMNSQKITNLATPTADTDAANKGYVDNAVAGLSWKDSVHLLAASNVDTAGNTGTLVIDSHAALTSAEDGYRLLLKGQTTSSDNGIYVYQDNGTTYTLVRATDADNYTELIGAAVFVKEGTLYGATAWVQSVHYLTSFAGQSWTQFSGQGTYTASNGVALSGNNFTFAPKTTGGLDTDSSGASIKLQTNSGLGTTSNGLAVGAGTGITVSTGTVSIDTSVVARKYSANVGDNSNSTITITHNLGTRDVIVSLREASSPYATVEPDIAMTTTNTVTLSFAVAPTTDQYRVTVIG